MMRVALGVVLGLGLAPISWAQEVSAVDSRSAYESSDVEGLRSHAHGPRHGGYVGDAEDLYHYELLLESPERLVLYVNDELNRPLDVRTLHGRYVLNPDDPAPIVGEFGPSQDGGYFLASFPLSSSDVVHLKIEVLKAGQWVGLEFFLPAPRSNELDSARQAGLPTAPSPD